LTTAVSSGQPTPIKPATDARKPLPSVPRWRRRLRPYLLSIPALLIVVGILIPFANGVYLTFVNYSAQTARTGAEFVGIDNYAKILGDSAFWNAVFITAIYAVAATGLETVLGVGIALLLNRSSIIGKIFEKVLILPLMIAPVIAGVLWRMMLNPQFGIINHILGLGASFDWFDSNWALASTILVDIWIYTPFVAILVLAGIRSLPKEPFEASAVDGASSFYMFRRLMLPMMWPYILVAVIFRVMDCIKVFDSVYVLTKGGPGSATTTLQINAYLQGMNYMWYSRASTYMFLLWILVYIAANYLVKLLGKAQARAAGEDV
jgi:multiple sugar transport system permease protein